MHCCPSTFELPLYASELISCQSLHLRLLPRSACRQVRVMITTLSLRVLTIAQDDSIRGTFGVHHPRDIQAYHML
jgi:hypothetical protein